MQKIITLILICIVCAGCSTLIPFQKSAAQITPGTKNSDQSAVPISKKGLTQKAAKSFELPDSTVTIAAGPGYEAGTVKRLLWGNHYRDAWTTKIEVPFINLNEQAGGLKVLAKTGGVQTITIIAEDPDGKKYVLRSIQKDPRRSLPVELQETFAAEIAQDQTSASHPYGGLIVPALAAAAEVYHTNPALGYVAETPGLDLSLSGNSGTLVTIEEFVNAEWFNKKYSKEAVDVVGSDELWEQLRAGSSATIDQRQLVRSRLFDMFIGDWDRHEKQWFWAKTPTDTSMVYQPIPIDRDNAFFRSDGFFLTMARIWVFPKFQNFGDDIQSIKGINLNAQYFDRWFMNELPEQEWIAIAKDMQQSLTDSVLAAAVGQWPEPIQRLNSETFIRKLQARRSKLPDFARRYYEILSDGTNIYGSDERELFEVKRSQNGDTRVRMYSIKKDSVSALTYSRLFKAEETDEIRLYGFGAADRFEISGPADTAITVRIIGGAGNDSVNHHSQTPGRDDKTWVYDTKKGISIESTVGVKRKTSDDPRVNRYQKRAFKYDFTGPLIATGYNSNDGLFLGGGAVIISREFRKEPFAAQHRITGKIATLTSAFSFNYDGIFTERLGTFDLTLGLDVKGPNFSSNFFGLGNETEQTREDTDFYGYRYDNVDAEVGLARQLNTTITVEAGLGYEYFDPSATEGRFVTSPAAQLNDADFRPNHYATLHAGATLSTVQNSIFPQNGLKVEMLSELNLGLNNRSKIFNQLALTGSAYYTLERITTTLATRAGLATNVGRFNFFQANTLSGQTFSGNTGNLRGFLRDRFSGRTSVFHNTDVRTKLFDFQSYFFPGSAGVLGFIDEGRVWSGDERSTIWHIGYGGGLWVSPFQQAILNTGIAFSGEERLFNLSLGFLF